MVRPTKSPNIISTTGRIPVIAAPTAIPVKPASEMGVSSIRSGPNSSTRPDRTLKAVPASATSSPITKTRGSRRSSSASASRTASPSVSSRIDVFRHLIDRRVRRGKRELHRLVDLLLDFRVNRVKRRPIGSFLLHQPLAQDLDRVAFGFPLLLFLFGAVVIAADVAHVMPSEAVGIHQQERGTFAAAASIH